jgi:hypothetical protein
MILEPFPAHEWLLRARGYWDNAPAIEREVIWRGLLFLPEGSTAQGGDTEGC